MKGVLVPTDKAPRCYLKYVYGTNKTQVDNDNKSIDKLVVKPTEVPRNIHRRTCLPDDLNLYQHEF